MTQTPPDAPTRVLCYAVGGDGRSGDLLAVGSLLLPYLTTFHPAPTDTNPTPNLDALRDVIGARQPGAVRVRLVVLGALPTETVDATLFFGGDDEDGGGWLASAVLDRPSRHHCETLPPAADPGASPVTRLHDHLGQVPLSLGDTDRSRRRPGRPRALTTSRRRTAPPTGTPWPPAVTDVRWVTQRPEWLPPLVPFPPLEVEVDALSVHCPIFCIKWFCVCG